MARKKKRKKKKYKRTQKAGGRSRRTKKVKRKSKKVRKTRKPKKKSKSRRKSKKVRKINFKTPTYSKDNEGNSVIKVSDSWANYAYVNESKYKKKYKLSIKENDKFWAKEGKRISWIKKYTKIKDEVVAASDAFFPFVDGIEKLVQSGVTAVIQPFGSIRDKEIINFADETNTILVFSKTRHFRH